jgi:membrane protein YqaA with SNARE-associated domain
MTAHAGLVLILAGAVCNVWQFVLVQTYARVGLYLFSTVFLSSLARKHKKLISLLFLGYKKIAIVLLLRVLACQSGSLKGFCLKKIVRRFLD